MWPHPTPGDHDLNKLNLQYLRICPYKVYVQLASPICFSKIFFFKSVFECKISPLLKLNHTQWINNLKKKKTWVYSTWRCSKTSYKTDCFLGRWPKPTPGNHDWNRLKSTLPEYASTRYRFSSQLYLRRHCFISLYFHM